MFKREGKEEKRRQFERIWQEQSIKGRKGQGNTKKIDISGYIRKGNREREGEDIRREEERACAQLERRGKGKGRWQGEHKEREKY